MTDDEKKMAKKTGAMYIENMLDKDHYIAPRMGQLIKEAREELGMTQQELAKAIRRRRASLSDIENGKMEADATTLALLAIVLRKPIAYFFPTLIHGFAGKEGATPEERDLINIFRQISNKSYQRLIIEQVKAIRDLNEREMTTFYDDYEESRHPEDERYYPGDISE